MTPDEFKAIRKHLGFTQAVLAKEMGKSRRQVQRYEENITEIPEHIIRMLYFLVKMKKFYS